MRTDSEYFDLALKQVKEQNRDQDHLMFGDSVSSLTHDQCQTLIKVLESNTVIKELCIIQEDLTDASFKGISKTKIEVLFIPSCSVTSLLVDELINMPKLRCLDISYTQINAEDDFIKLLNNLKELELLRITPNKSDLDLKTKYPKTTITICDAEVISKIIE
jgi:hypothetical protein